MPIVVGVTFKSAGKMYYFDPRGLEVHEGMHVLAQTARGLEYGAVVMEPREVRQEEIVNPLKPLVRLATEQDAAKAKANQAREQEAFSICQRKIAEHNLPMKLIEVESTFDGSRMVFYFGAEARVDFRTLVKDLAGTLKTRIELRQVGVRDEAKLMGGIGTCGRPLCCATFMCSFAPVGIKMAKEQGLSLNPLKISGVCGRLLCCLNYEYGFYKEAKERFPKVNSQVETPRGPGRVMELSVPKETVTVALDEGGRQEFALTELQLPLGGPCASGGLCRKEGSRHPRRREGNGANDAETAEPPCRQAQACPRRPARSPMSGAKEGQTAPRAADVTPPAKAAPTSAPVKEAPILARPVPESAPAGQPAAAPPQGAQEQKGAPQAANGGHEKPHHSHRSRPRKRRRRPRQQNSSPPPS